ncbi:hypothetical protein AB0E08_07550 [Streptomyces sp. NPDC048281]|uniref:hypothetical protein n=1 Tax=Streptomyces sp. NPDC048281 TaxID=3154715 RepID=UPI00344634C7
MTFANADAWADALDDYQTQHGMSAGDVVSRALADGAILGVTLDPRHPASDDERPHLASDSGWVVRFHPSEGWWDGVDWPVWTLAHEAGGSTDAAWTLRYGIGADTEIRKTCADLGPDNRDAAQKWFTDWLADRMRVTVTSWTAYHPGPGTQPTHWVAKED